MLDKTAVLFCVSLLSRLTLSLVTPVIILSINLYHTIISRDFLLGVGCCNSHIQLWDLEAGQQLSVLTGHTREVHTIQVADNGSVISSSGDCTVKIWDQKSSACVSTLIEHSASVMTLQVRSLNITSTRYQGIKLSSTSV
jgi:WD40 repeat protein